jgi:hypothetical protein
MEWQAWLGHLLVFFFSMWLIAQCGNRLLLWDGVKIDGFFVLPCTIQRHGSERQTGMGHAGPMP